MVLADEGVGAKKVGGVLVNNAYKNEKMVQNISAKYLWNKS